MSREITIEKEQDWFDTISDKKLEFCSGKKLLRELIVGNHPIV
jgi:hypothetical protein